MVERFQKAKSRLPLQDVNWKASGILLTVVFFIAMVLLQDPEHLALTLRVCESALLSRLLQREVKSHAARVGVTFHIASMAPQPNAWHITGTQSMSSG